MLEIEDKGIINLRIGAVTLDVDAYELWNRIVELRQKCDDEQLPVREYHEGIVAILRDRGFGTVSHFAADQLAVQLSTLVANLGKVSGGEPTPDSPPPSEPPY